MDRTLVQATLKRIDRPGMRTQAWALGLLIVMLGLLVLSTLLSGRFPALLWLRAFAEAASVGALADWFAVVALFRRPLGLPIPHSAVIPRNKTAIGRALGRFVEQNFLSPDRIAAELARTGAARAALDWLSQPDTAEAVAAALAAALPRLLAGQDPRAVAERLADLVADGLAGTEGGRLRAALVDAVLASGLQQQLLDRGLETFADWMDEHHTELESHFHLGSRYTPEFLDRYLAGRVLSGIEGLLREIATDPDHSIRRRFDAMIAQFAQAAPTSIEGDTVSVASLAVLLRVGGVVRLLMLSLRRGVDTDLAQPESTLRQALARGVRETVRNLLEDPERLALLDAWLADRVRVVIAAQRHRVGQMIADVVAGWDAAEIAGKIEAQVGNDLQFIRINGTLVGGAAGVVLHGLLLLLPPV